MPSLPPDVSAPAASDPADLTDSPAGPASLSLTRTEAEQRAATIVVRRTEITLDLTRPGPTFDSVSVIELALRDGVADGAETFVDVKAADLTAVELNGQPLDVADWRQGRFPLTGLRRRNTLRVSSRMAYSSDGEGLHRHTDPADQRTYLYAMSFLTAGPRWFASFDQPDLKSAYELDVTAPVDWTVLGNGPSTQTEPGHWLIRPTAPLSTYFVTLVAGPYASSYREHDGIRLGFHARASLAESLEAEVADLAEVTAQSFDFYHRLFGVRYPFGEYHQAFVPDFNAGAMENPGCVTLRDQYVYRGRATRSERASRAGTVAHELAHMWFGDLVTMRWWDDLWLNESFAEYAAHRCCTEATGYPLWTEFGIVRKDWGSVADQSPSTHPVAGNGAADAEAALQDFDGISYAKGAAVLKQLVAHLGDDVFLAGLRDHFARHAYGNATLDDLLGSWQRAGASDLDAWAEAWLQTAGLDTLAVSGTDLVRRPPAGSGPGSAVARPHTVVVSELGRDGREQHRQQVTVDSERTPLWSGGPGSILVPDAADDTWAKMRFGADWTRLGELLPAIERPATRVVVVNALRDAVRGGEVDPARALDLLCEAAVAEAEDVVTGSVLRFCSQVLAGPYAPVTRRAERLARVQRAAQQILGRAAEGSDRQLLGFRHAILSDADPEQLRGWLASDRLPAGLALDPELTWSLVLRLAELTADADVLDRAARRDPSAAGRVHAARGRAALPSAEAKRAAWSALSEPSDVSASELYAIAKGFFRPAQTDLTEPYVVRFFDEMPRTAAFRSGWALGQVVADVFPLAHSDPTTLELAEQTLARGDLPAAVRRSMTDGADALRRAVVSLARFGYEH